MVEVFLLLVAVVFALNIGASGAAATMGQVYGGGALTKRATLILVALFALAGAVVAGREVVHTVSEGIVADGVITSGVALVVLAAALIPLFIANLIGVPLSTSEVTVGAVVGVGLALGGLDVRMVGIIALSWALLPPVAFAISAVIQAVLGHPLEHYLEERERKRLSLVLVLLLVVGGSFAAFSAGANNAANAFGPLVGAGVVSTGWALALGGVFMGLGALALGGRVLETSGRRLTPLTLPGGITVSFTTGSLILVLSLLGIPAPLTQANTGAILGVGFAHRGIRILQRDVVKKVASVWLLSPALAMVLAFFLLNFFQGLEGDFGALITVVVLSGAMVLGAVWLRGGVPVVRRGAKRVAVTVASLGVHHGHHGWDGQRAPRQEELVGVLQRHRHDGPIEGD